MGAIVVKYGDSTMFDVRAAIQEAEECYEFEGLPSANPANPANNGAKISNFSNFSRPSSPRLENRAKLAVAIRLYGESEIIPLTEDEIADYKINKLKLREDRMFVFEILNGTRGKQKLELVSRYFEERQKGKESEPVEHKKENTGRKRANTWLRKLKRGAKS
jgi:hypothetical protein